LETKDSRKIPLQKPRSRKPQRKKLKLTNKLQNQIHREEDGRCQKLMNQAETGKMDVKKLMSLT
jgi:hypothetical protein